VRLAERAVEIDGSRAMYWNTLGVAHYRDGQYQKAIQALERSLQSGGDSTAGFDLVFLALCHARLGDDSAADDCFRRAAAWLESRKTSLAQRWIDELSQFLAEATAAGIPRGG
jgi:uncharacterized protein HemY